MWDVLTFPFFWKAVLAGMLFALTGPCIGVFLIMRRQAALADTLSHGALLGVALGMVTSVLPLWTALATAVMLALMAEYIRSHSRLTGEGTLTLLAVMSLALAVLIISTQGGFSAGLFAALFGTILSIGTQELVIMGVLALVTFVMLWRYAHEFFITTYHPLIARADGIPVLRYQLGITLLAACAVVLGVQTLGALLTAGLMIVPGLIALLKMTSFRGTMLFSVLLALSAVMGGLLAAALWDVPPSSAIVLMLLMGFAYPRSRPA